MTMNKPLFRQSQIDPQRSSTLERAFDTRWRQLGGPDLYCQVPLERFHFDRADPIVKVAIELDGGTWANKEGAAGQHVRGVGYATMCRKNNAAILAGWVVFRITTDMLTGAAVQHLQPIIDYISTRR